MKPGIQEINYTYNHYCLVENLYISLKKGFFIIQMYICPTRVRDNTKDNVRVVSI